MARLSNTNKVIDTNKSVERIYVNKNGEVTRTVLTNTKLSSTSNSATKSKNRSVSTFKPFIGVILVIMLFDVLSGFAGYIGTYGQVYERDYVTQSYINEDYTIDMTGFDSYCEMTVPSSSITQGILPKVQAISILVDNITPMSMEFEEWSAINTPNLYALRNGTGLERGIWNFCSMFTKLYFNIFVKFCHIPQIFEVIGTLLK